MQHQLSFMQEKSKAIRSLQAPSSCLRPGYHHNSGIAGDNRSCLGRTDRYYRTAHRTCCGRFLWLDGELARGRIRPYLLIRM